MATITSFRSIKNKHDVYRGKNCMKKFCESLRARAMKIILKRKKMKLLTKEQQESYENAKKKKKLKINISEIKNIVKLEIIVTIQGNIEGLRIAYVI